MKIGILQPGYLPWLGFFEQLYRADLFVLYDDVAYDKQGWRNRNRVKTAAGAKWLTVPVLTGGRESVRLHEARIDNRRPWRRKHLETIRQSYAPAPYFDRHYPWLAEAYGREWETLVELDLFLIRRLAEALGLAGKSLLLSSSLQVTGDRLGRLVEICRRLGADTFYEGAAGRNYIDESVFAAAGVRVEYQDYSHPAYRQLHGEFVPYLSVLDLILNHGPDSLAILLGARTGEPAEDPAARGRSHA